ncbi:MAG: STT3 domain-containing protein [Nanoarchaeota archaeon]
MTEVNLEERRKAIFLKLEDLFDKAKNKSTLLYWLGLIPIFFIAWYIRTQNLGYLVGKYLVELDSYFFYRYAKEIFETGTLPLIDHLRYAPLGYETAPFKFFPQTLAYMFKVVHVIFPNMAQIEWHIYYPPVIAIIGFIFFFLFVKEIFNYRVALLSTAFLTVIPAYIQRTSAGFADHEVMAILWMFLSLWLLALMWKSKDWKFIIALSTLSALFASAMVYTWGGYRYLTLSIALFFILAIFLSEVDNKKFTGLMIWFAIVTTAISSYYGGLDINRLTTAEFAPVWFAVFAFAIMKIIPKIKQLEPIIDKLSLRITTILICIGTGLTIAILSGRIQHYLSDFLGSIFNIIIIDIKSKFYLTVSESQKPEFYGGSGLWTSFGWLIVLSMIGMAILIYYILKNKDEENFLQNKFALVGAALFLLFTILFTIGSFENSSSFGTVVTNSLVYLSFIIFAGLVIVFYKLSKSKSNIFTSENALFLLALSIAIVGFIFSHNQIRLLFSFSPIAAIMSAYLIDKIYDLGKRKLNPKYTKFIAVGLLVLVIFLMFSLGNVAIQYNKGIGSMLPGQWEQSMDFIRTETPENSVIAHWWDYGHMTATIGERASVTDGGNLRSWNHNSARFLMTGKNKEATMTYLNTHGVTHILFSREEIPKYSAFSLIGSEGADLDRASTIGTFSLSEQREIRNGTLLIYGGGWPLDKEYIHEGKVLDSGNSGIIAFSLDLPNGGQLQNPHAYIIYGQQQFPLNIGCVYANGQKLSFPRQEPYMEGCLALVPYYNSETDVSIIGGAFWLSEKTYDTNLARLYIYGENDQNFKLVYTDNTPLGYFQGNLIGPIKIWEVIYNGNEKTNLKLLEPNTYG